MKNNVYVTRHGEFRWNVEGKVQGVTDTPLTDKGREQAKKQFAYDYNGGESMLRLGQRIFNLLDEIHERMIREDKTFLLVTHGGIVRMINAYFNSETNEEFSSTSIYNCELREFRSSDTGAPLSGK